VPIAGAILAALVPEKPSKPSSEVPDSPLSRGEARAWGRLREGLSEVEGGSLRFLLPDASSWGFGEEGAEPEAEVQVREGRFFSRVLRYGRAGLAESYEEGEWECDDLVGLAAILHGNRELLPGDPGPLARLGRWGEGLRQVLRRRRARDLREPGDELFERMLDETLCRSCALFESPGELLEQAQQNKLRALMEKARLAREHHVLEVGAGWGALAMEAARAFGCRVTALTETPSRLETVRRLVREAGLEKQVSVERRELSDIEGRYDRILAVEAVDAPELGPFFEMCERRLKPGGVVVLQAVTRADEEPPEEGASAADAAAAVPTLAALREAMKAGSRLRIDSLEDVGPHYPQTIRCWRERFEARAAELEPLGYDERFRRAWRFHLACQEAGFATRAFRNLQFVLSRDIGPAPSPPAAP
jgi:cyclopropane-fatty-acyl-phospholipid synthase